MSDKASAYAAFVAAQKEFAPALKSSSNPHFKSKYADLAACVEAVLDALNNHGLAVMQRPVNCESGVTVRTLFLHVSGEEIDGGELHVPAAKSDPQGYGSALTYCRRYGLMAACGIAPEDDDGNAASKAPSRQQQARPPARPMADKAVTDPAILVKAMEATKSLESLKTAFASAWKASGHDESVKAAYDRLKGLYVPEAPADEVPA
jgi:hypothetical protein